MAEDGYFVALRRNNLGKSFLIPPGTKREHLYPSRGEGVTIVQVSKEKYDLIFNLIAERISNHG